MTAPTTRTPATPPMITESSAEMTSAPAVMPTRPASAPLRTIEGSGVMADLNGRLADDEDLREEYAAAGGRYVAFRNALGERVPSDPAAGGMPERVKCLHSLYGHHLATDDNPIGEWVAGQLEPMGCPKPCATLPDEHPAE